MQSVLDVLVSQAYQYPKLSSSQQKELVEKTKQGDLEARNALVMSLLGQIIDQGVRSGRNLQGTVTVEDSVLEILFSYLKNVENFDDGHGTKPSTYLYRAGANHFTRELRSKKFSFEVEENVLTRVFKSVKAYNELTLQGGDVLQNVAHRLNATVKAVEYDLWLNSMLTALSTSLLIENESSGIELGEMVIDEQCDDESNVFDQVFLHQINPYLEHFVSTDKGKTRARMVMSFKLRFGLEDGIERTYQEIGEMFGVKRQMANHYVNKVKDFLKKYIRLDTNGDIVFRPIKKVET